MADLVKSSTAYQDGYVWEFKVNNGSKKATVGVKAVAVDENLIDTTVTKDSVKLITSGAVETFVLAEVAKAGKVEIIVPDDGNLPTASEDTMGKIYLIPKTGTGKNIKTEWITYKKADNTYDWEQIGDTAVDISGLASITYVNTELAKKVDKETGKSLLADTEITRLADIESRATNVTIDDKTREIAHGETKLTIPLETTIKDKTGETGVKTVAVGTSSVDVYGPAYDTIELYDAGGNKIGSTHAASTGRQFNIQAGNDKITIEATTDHSGNPTIKISAASQIAPSNPASPSAQGQIFEPYYKDGTIDMTNNQHITSSN